VTAYNVQVSTDGTNTAAIWPYGFAAATVPAGASPQYTFSGLNANTTYYLRVNTAGNDSTTAWTNLGSTSTLPNPPATVASTFTALSTGSFTASWSANGNAPAVTAYFVQVSTDGTNYGGSSLPYEFSAATVPAGASPQYTFTGLNANTTYYFRVETIGNDYTTAWASLGSTSNPAQSRRLRRLRFHRPQHRRFHGQLGPQRQRPVRDRLHRPDLDRRNQLRRLFPAVRVLGRHHARGSQSPIQLHQPQRQHHLLPPRRDRRQRLHHRLDHSGVDLDSAQSRPPSPPPSPRSAPEASRPTGAPTATPHR